mmetsp:Transcript_21901/g.62099  ORF Transcript_21901/g.62099 Transcript_21901/m.62099 type:complete len:142 (-) Transcript_21901:257-682(-)
MSCTAREVADLTRAVAALTCELAAKQERIACLDRAIAATKRLCELETELQDVANDDESWCSDFSDCDLDDTDEELPPEEAVLAGPVAPMARRDTLQHDADAAAGGPCRPRMPEIRLLEGGPTSQWTARAREAFMSAALARA